MPRARLLLALLLTSVLSTGGAAVASQRQTGPGQDTSRMRRHLLERDVVWVDAEGTARRAVRCAIDAAAGPGPPAADTSVARVLEITAEGRAEAIVVPVVVHVIRGRRQGKRIGDVDDDRIAAQIEVLNRSFERLGYSFRLDRVERVNKKRWYAGCGSWWIEERMKERLADDPARKLNLYTCGDEFLGYSTLPWSYPPDHFLHGVVIHHETLPGGTAAPYDEGDTAVHETGHYLGLLHTFDGGCREGDLVSDTAPEDSPAFGCPARRDTCSGGGPDPIVNFMDYSDDACMEEFTRGQGQRLRQVVAEYKPGLGR